MSKSSTDSTSAWLGTLIRSRRKQLGLTQKDVAERLGVTAQQIQKYESGVDALRISRLLEFSHVLGYSFERSLLSFVRMHQASGTSFEATGGEAAAVLCEEPGTFRFKEDEASEESDPVRSEEGSSVRPSKVLKRGRKKTKTPEEELSAIELETFLERFLTLSPSSQRSLFQLVAQLSQSSSR